MALDTELINRLKQIKLIISDFDGVFTDNFVYLNELGEETVRCTKYDSLSIHHIKDYLGINIIVLSNEQNQTVYYRCKKLSLRRIQIVGSKLNELSKIMKMSNIDNKENIMFIGNDLNDIELIKSGIFSACPSDSHDKVKSLVNLVFKTKGGHGIFMELLNLMES